MNYGQTMSSFPQLEISINFPKVTNDSKLMKDWKLGATIAIVIARVSALCRFLYQICVGLSICIYAVKHHVHTMLLSIMSIPCK